MDEPLALLVWLFWFGRMFVGVLFSASDLYFDFHAGVW